MTEDKSKHTETASTTLIDYLKAWPLYLLPQHLLSRLMLGLTRVRFAPVKNLHIAWFIRHFKVNMDETPAQAPADYPTFNHFFTRPLKPGVRQVVSGSDELACPVDGKVSQAGPIRDGMVFQAKGHEYSLEALLGDASLAREFGQGSFATLYLSPRDYHRIHMPCDGTLREMRHIPGRLFSVNEASVKVVPGLFAINERVVTVFDTAHGPVALVLVGAIFVGSIETVWQGVITPPTRHEPRLWQYPLGQQPTPTLHRGEEMGRFNMGSTVIAVFANPKIQLDQAIQHGAPVRLGQRLAALG
ncbi:MAG: archaetidylserine decarboxylase [Pseudomonadota bacterium]